MKLLRIVVIFSLLLLAVSLAHAQSASNSLEYRVKAVVLFNFAKYVRWPEKTFQTAAQPIRICVVGDNPFGDLFTSEDAPKEAQGRPLQIVTLPQTSSKEELFSCQLLYWLEKSEALVSSLESDLAAHSVLTVADSKSSLALISFTLEEGKVRFRIRNKAAKEVGLNISSQVLKLAIIDDE